MTESLLGEAQLGKVQGAAARVGRGHILEDQRDPESPACSSSRPENPWGVRGSYPVLGAPHPKGPWLPAYTEGGQRPLESGVWRTAISGPAPTLRVKGGLPLTKGWGRLRSRVYTGPGTSTKMQLQAGPKTAFLTSSRAAILAILHAVRT